MCVCIREDMCTDSNSTGTSLLPTNWVLGLCGKQRFEPQNEAVFETAKNVAKGIYSQTILKHWMSQQLMTSQSHEDKNEMDRAKLF